MRLGRVVTTIAAELTEAGTDVVVVERSMRDADALAIISEIVPTPRSMSATLERGLEDQYDPLLEA